MPPTAAQLQNIFNNKLGLRVGGHLAGAAYGMDDFGMDDKSAMQIFMWTANPASSVERGLTWDQHLHNTIWKIFDVTDIPFNLMIVNFAPHDAGRAGESYSTLGGGVGDQRTFIKCNRLSPNSVIVVQRQIVAGDTIQTIVDWVMQNI